MTNSTTNAQPGPAQSGPSGSALLSEKHWHILTVESGITPEVIAERACYTITALAQLTRLAFPAYQWSGPGMVFPVHTTNGEVLPMVYRPDVPRKVDGKPRKYDQAEDTPVRLDCPPRCRPQLLDADIPLWVTEGTKKGDCLASQGLCVIDLPGVWGFRVPKKIDPQQSPLPDWKSVQLGGRLVTIVFDSDVRTNADVARARDLLATFLTSRGATVRYCTLDPLPTGAKQGVDDFLAAGHTLADLEALAQVPTHGSPAASAGDCWSQGQTAEEFLGHEDPEVLADARDIVVPGCITVIAAPRASGKSIVVLSLAVSLAHGGVFRGEPVPQRRVALIDRDNPPSLVRKRLRALGAQRLTTLTVFTRDKAAPLTDAAAWAAFPTQQFDVIIVDSIGASTEGVSEKEGKQTQQYLATLKDLAQRGPAVLCLDNTNKAAQNYRGRGEKGDAVDILYEARNITGWGPSHGGDWWEDLPDCGEHTWQQRASRRKGQPVMQIAFVPSKFRLAIEPEPFVLAIDTTQDPWTLDDITEDIATAGQRAADETARLERAKLLAAETALCYALRTRDPAQPMLKREAENFLCAQGLRQKVARTLLMQGGNHDLSPAGRWVLREILGARGNPIAVYLAGEEDHNQNNHNAKSSPINAESDPSISVDGSTPHNQNTLPFKPAETLGKNGAAFGLRPGDTSTEINHSLSKENGCCLGGGIISVAYPHSNDRDESCLHEHVNTLGVCNDCGEILER